ncbi:Glutamate receptor 2-like 9 [Homarus americanus]|uniref:Glutamate receptor 2-like 9 n=2 Tax=Homarus americanus TaxID=6706 RepID=A0A8J5N373_HOMAM|nr:Glutamate receptor 2-like 9 [Homarus americanus]
MKFVLDIFAKMINFDYELVPAPGNKWGAPLANGSFSGMMGLLQREEVELAIAPFFVTPPRETAADFSEPVYYDSYAILMVRPEIVNDMSGFLKPFAPTVWLMIVLSLLCMTVAMSRVARYEEVVVFSLPATTTWAKATLWAIQAFSQEGSHWLPRKHGGRLLVSTWLMASLVFMSSYSGILTAMLTVPRVNIPIDSLKDLVAQSDLPWRIEADSFMYNFFLKAEDNLRQGVFSKKAGTFQDCWADRQAIADGEFAAICDRITMMKAMSWDFSTTGRCHLYISREKVYDNGYLSIAFKTKSKYLPAANKIIKTLKMTGHLNKWLADQITNTTQCLKPPSADIGAGISPLSIEAFSGPLLVLLTGLTMGGVVLVAEHLMKLLD